MQPFGRSIFVDVKKDFGIRTCLDLEKSEKAGLILDRAKGIAVVLDRATKQMRVVREDGNISFVSLPWNCMMMYGHLQLLFMQYMTMILLRCS